MRFGDDVHATFEFEPTVIHPDCIEDRPMDILLTDPTTAGMTTITLPMSIRGTSDLVARHRLSDEEPAPDEDDPAVEADDDDDDKEEDDWKDDDDDDEDWDDEDLDDDDDDWDDDDDDDEDWDDDDDDDDDAPANRLFRRTPITVRS